MNKFTQPLPTYEAVDLGLSVFRLKLKLYSALLASVVGCFGGVVLHSNLGRLAWIFPPAGLIASVYGLGVYGKLEREQALLDALPHYTLSTKSQRLKDFIGSGNFLLPPDGMVEGAGENFAPQALTPQLIKQLPHIMILGSTGSGKTTLVNEVLNNIEGDVIICDPHSYPGLWGNLPVVSDYGEISKLLVSCTLEMYRRYALRRQGKQLEFTPINLLIDEFPGVANHPQIKRQYPHDDTTKDSIFIYWFQRWLCEARKVNMRMILLSQGSSVKSLNLQGQSELLENLNILRLGKFAKKHANSTNDDTLTQWIKSQKRPGMIDDEPLIIPEIKDNSIRNRADLSDDNLAWIECGDCGDDDHHTTTDTTTNHHDREQLERLWNMNPTTNHHNHHHHHDTPINLDKVPTPPPPLSCPECSSVELIKHSRTSSGRDRKRCKSCGKIFTI